MKTVLYIIRHAEAAGNIIRRFHGWTDGELTQKGHEQAKLLSKRLAAIDFDNFYSSTLSRAYTTAKYIAEEKNKKVIKIAGLKEINGGDWEGQEWSLLPKKYPQTYNNWDYNPHLVSMPNGESMSIFKERLVTSINEIINENVGKKVCIVTHGTAIRVLMTYFKDISFDKLIDIPWFDNTAVSIVDYKANKYHILKEGDTTHLNNEMSTIKHQAWWQEINTN